MVRVAVPSQDDAEALPIIAKKADIPVIADIHFQPKYVFAAIDAGCAGVRVNPATSRPSTTGWVRSHAPPVMPECPSHRGQRRIAGQTSAREVRQRPPRKRWWKVPWEASLFEEHDFRDIKISVKHHDPVVMVQAYRQLSAACDYPGCTWCHRGGPGLPGTIKSAVAFGALLGEGSATRFESPVGAAGRRGEGRTADPRIAQPARERGLEIVSCPSCGRAQVDVYTLAEQVTAGLQGLEVPLRVAVMGCVVNGPGRLARLISAWPAATARARSFVKGEVIKTVPEAAIVETLIEEAMRLAESMESAGDPTVSVG